MKIFAETDLSEFLEYKLNELRTEINREDKNRLLNVNETEYIDYLVDKYRVEPLVFYWDTVSVSDREDMISADQFPQGFHVREGQRYPKQVITYHIPFSGESKLLNYAPSPRLLWTMTVDVRGNSVCFDIVNYRDDPEEVKREADRAISDIREQSGYAQEQVKMFNANLERNAREAVQTRKAQHLKQSNLMASLGVHVKRVENIPSTFAVPTLKKQPLIKPSAPTSAFVPEPTLDESIYNSILRICNETGIEMERHPSIYKQKDEETLRDHFIMVLSPHFQSVTGETFNKSGKTDILIKHEKSNVFVAECKFWSGMKAFHKTIDQILSYLTWRDSKAAIICFIKTKTLNTVLEQIEVETKNHPRFVKYKEKVADGWFSFEFHLKDDETRGVKLAVLCFHFPA